MAKWRVLWTVLLLVGSNGFMTYAWYYHVKQRAWPLLMAIGVSWLIALPEYCLQVPANRWGHGTFSAFQLKIMNEIITIGVFVVFAMLYLGEKPQWNHLVAFGFILGAVWFAFFQGLPARAG